MPLFLLQEDTKEFLYITVNWLSYLKCILTCLYCIKYNKTSTQMCNSIFYMNSDMNGINFPGTGSHKRVSDTLQNMAGSG